MSDAGEMEASFSHQPPDCALPLIEGSVGDALRRTAARFPDRGALAWWDGERIASISYAEVLAQAERVANWLLGFGAPGDRIAVWSRNTVEWILAEYGCTLAGMTIASWNPAWTDFECERARDLTEPVLVLAGHDTRGVSLLERARAIGGEAAFPLGYILALAGSAPLRELPQRSGADPFLIQFTSGTTGRAKGATLSHRAALNSAWLRAMGMAINESDVLLNPAPMSHIGGAVHMLLGAMVTGACYVVMNRFEAGEYLRLMRLCGATQVSGVPTMLLALLEHPDWVPGSFCLRSVASGGAQVPQPLIERLMREFGAPVFVAFGQSECPTITTTVVDDDPSVLANTVGRPSPHVELQIRDLETGRTVRRGEVGEICVRGPVVMDGYFRMPGATNAAIDAAGFLRTGDLGSLDEEGYVRIAGRCRDVIIRGGENIYPAEVEDALGDHPDVSAVAVVGIPDERWGQQVGAAVLPRAGCAPTAESLQAHAAARLSHFKVPRRWLFVEAFPLTASGKIRKVDVEALFQQPEGLASADGAV